MSDVEITFGTNAGEAEREIRKLNRTVDKSEKLEDRVARAKKKSERADRELIALSGRRVRAIKSETAAIKERERATKKGAQPGGPNRLGGALSAAGGAVGGGAGGIVSRFGGGISGLGKLGIAVAAAGTAFSVLTANLMANAQRQREIAQQMVATNKSLRAARSQRGSAALGALQGQNLQQRQLAQALNINDADIRAREASGEANALGNAIAERKLFMSAGFNKQGLANYQGGKRIAKRLSSLGLGSYEELLSTPDLAGRVGRAGEDQVMREIASERLGGSVSSAQIDAMLSRRGKSAEVAKLQELEAEDTKAKGKMKDFGFANFDSAIAALRNGVAMAIEPQSKILLEQHQTMRDQMEMLRITAANTSMMAAMLQNMRRWSGGEGSATKEMQRVMIDAGRVAQGVEL